MTNREGRIETRPQDPQGEEKGLFHDVAAGALGGAAWDGAKVLGGHIIGQLRPSSQPPDVPFSSVPSNGPGAPDTAPDWNWPRG